MAFITQTSVVEESAQLGAALVLDTVDSTARRAKLGEIAANEIDRAERAELRSLVEGEGGALIVATGDGAVALLPSASAAVRVALAVRGTQYRIGIAVGEVREVQPGMWTGAPLQVATDLERRCPVGEVAASLTAARVATSVAFETELLDGSGEPIVLIRPSASATP